MEYITKIVQSTQGMGNEDSADGCKGYINVFLMWIIQNAKNSWCSNWQGIAKGFYDLIDVTKLRRSDFINYSIIWRYSICTSSLFSYLNHIVCNEDDAQSIERLQIIERLCKELNGW
ncbi:hypothetical protein NEAUS03_0013 [Nematocida ausubeli]|nr:hypothetical protein NEAUS03_0013 [Nematocida ausubeli]